jgi:hypothetical protein
MSQKNIAHRSDIFSRQSNHYGRNALVAIGFLFVIGLVFGLITMLPKAKPDTSVNSVAAVQYSNAMAMQYAQSWLAKSQTAVASVVPFNDALAMKYAQPWLDAQSVHTCNGRLDIMYACQNGN